MMVNCAIARMATPPLQSYYHHKGCLGGNVGRRYGQRFAGLGATSTPRSVNGTVLVIFGPGISALAICIHLNTGLVADGGQHRGSFAVFEHIAARRGNNHLQRVGVVDEGGNIGKLAVVGVGIGGTFEKCAISQSPVASTTERTEYAVLPDLFST